jgi:hypothetical protein
MNAEPFARGGRDSGESHPNFATPLSRELIELLSRLGHQIQPLNNPATPPARRQAVEIARNLLLAVVDYVEAGKAPADPGLDREELAEMAEEIAQAERIVGRETWLGMFGVQSKFQLKQDEAYRQLGLELVGFFRRQFRNFDKLIKGSRACPAWEDAYETFLEELSTRW